MRHKLKDNLDARLLSYYDDVLASPN